MAFRFPSQPGGESVVPAQLVLVLVRSRRLPVGRVEAHDSKLAHRRADYALGVVGETGNAVLHGNRLGSREDGDAVVGLLAAEYRFVAGGAHLGKGKDRVLDFRLL